MGIHLHVWRAVRRRPVPAGAATATLVAVAVAAGAAAFSDGADRTGAPAATVRVDRGEVTSAVAATGSVRPAASRGLAFTAVGTVTEVRVRPGVDVTVGQVLAVLDDAEAHAEVTRAEQALADARAVLDDLEGEPDPDTLACDTSPVSATRGDGAGGAAGGTAGDTVRSTPSGDTGSPTPGADPDQPSPSATPSVTRSATPTPTGSSDSPVKPSASGTGKGPAATVTAPTPADPRGCPTEPGGSGPGGNAAGADPLLRAHQQVTAAQLALAEAADRLAGTTITAPVAGRVLSVAGPVGTRVSAGARFIELAVVDGMQVTATFPEADAGQIAVGQTATVTPAGRPDTELDAEVVQVDPVGTSDGQVVRFGVRLALGDAPDDLLIGQSAAVRIRIATVADVLRLPAGAVEVRRDGAGTVLVAGAAEPRPVVVGLRGDQFVEIRSGLAEGDLLLAAG
ncbi:efflux RND transporter periplasmic adaptor subunit [Micromonospora endolithica]|uniref:HlyD family efflux transporter periplasmic adaptor subunit n=1 Tax=Micromonospora endolithica TaxID=230091 RepID=A0A3A9YZA5_9ACTN|nr:efflux RND transporter periplasmic adaptor subunit [Micromonospora endolithica]RKN41069.1 HlyD family efflux transporter periplasmic adaptor subunit [Micromonospora endolithica]TWJ24292.1 HlyD family secretion protein [Micromonospora endolithica]